MADGAHDGGARRRDRADEALVAEPQQGLRVAAAPRDDDDVDLGIGIEPLERREHLRHAALALHRRIGRAEEHLRPAQLGVAMDVALGVAALAGDEADQVGQERQRLLARVVEQALRAQLRAQALQALELVAEARRGASSRPGTRSRRP